MTDLAERGGVRRYLDSVEPSDFRPDLGAVDVSTISLTGLADLYGSDKGGIKHHYTTVYETLIERLLAGRDRRVTPLRVAEFGVACGASLRMWASYLPASTIDGYDIRDGCSSLCRDVPNVRARTLDVCAPGSTLLEPLYDLIVDDASHISEHIVAALNNHCRSIAPGGFYVIEDLCCTYDAGYTERFQSMFKSPANNNRMAVVAMVDLLMREIDSRPQGFFSEMLYYPRMLVLRKAPDVLRPSPA